MNSKFSTPSLPQLGQFVLLLIWGGVFGAFAWWLTLPLPFMLGGLIGTMILVSWGNRSGRVFYFPRILRMFFIGLIGSMIGSTFSPDLMATLPTIVSTLAVLTVHILILHFIGYHICRRVGRYDAVTAFYSAMPGGFIEAVILGEKGGGNVQILTMSHFLRLCSVVILVPAFFYFYLGDAVGSAAGQSFETRPWQWSDLMILLAITLAGLVMGRFLHIPAGHLLGPMLLAAALFGTGVASASSPTWLLFAAQLVTGVGLGTQLTGARSSTLQQILLASALMIVIYLSFSVLAAFAVWELAETRFDALFLSFAPGGVTEMGLIALSLSLSPVLVSAHHVYRIFVTVFIAAVSTRWFRRSQDALEKSAD